MNAGWGLWPRISWNPPDFTLKSGGFHLWNPAEFTQISSMKSTQNYKSKCFSKNSSVWWMQGGGYDQGFHKIHWISCEIHMKSTRFQNYELLRDDQVYRSFVFRKTNQKSFCWNIWFYKVWGGFHVKSKDLLQGIVTLCFVPLNAQHIIVEHVYVISSGTFTVLDLSIVNIKSS